MKKALIILVTAVFAASAGVGGYFGILRQTEKNRYNCIEFSNGETKAKDVIYFLNTGSSDAIVLQSGNHFAMIDAGEDSDNPRGFENLAYEGYEELVLNFIKKTAGDASGKVQLDFILGTHSHSDHIGGFDTVINDDNVSVGKAYLKKYNAEIILDSEIENWDNQEVYDQMVEALENKSIPIISDISEEPFSFGNFTLTILNTQYENSSRKVGENDNSLVVLAEIHGKKILLTGDLDNYTGDEVRIADKVGKVDILKAGHHSYSHSTERKFLSITNPSLTIVTNSREHSDKRTLRRILKKTKSPILFSDDEQGIALIFNENGYEIKRNIT